MSQTPPEPSYTLRERKLGRWMVLLIRTISGATLATLVAWSAGALD